MLLSTASTVIFLFFLFSSSLHPKNTMLTGSEMIINGDFENDTVGIQSDYHYSPNNLKPEGYWSILKNPWDVFYQFSNCSDHTTGDGHMMCLNGHYEPNKVVWEQTVINIQPNTTFFLSMWFASVNSLRPPSLSIYINNEELTGSPYQMSADTCLWQNFTCDWNSGNSTSATIKIINNNLVEIGNDFALDDISFMPYCTVNADAGDDITICYGEQIVTGKEATGGVPPYQYEWEQHPGIIATNQYSATIHNNETAKYFLKVTDDIGCIDYDTITVTVVPEIDFKIETNVDIPACPCETVILSGPEGYNYSWSTGETTKDITVTESGEYSLEVETIEGCSASDRLYVEISTAEYFVDLDDAKANSGETVVIPFEIFSSNTNPRCNFDDFFIRLRYNKSLLLPQLSDSFVQYTEDDYQIIEYSGNINNYENSLKFIATLGNSSCTDIEIEEFNVGCHEVRLNLNSGKFCSSNICLDPTPRLFDDTGQFFLSQNKPNPASGITSIQFGIIERGNTRISLMNMLGEEVDLISDKSLDAGIYNIDYNVSGLTPGVYFIVLDTPSQLLTRSFVVV